MLAALGAGEAADAIAQIAAEGIVTDIAFVRADVAGDAEVDDKIAAIAGNAASRTGIYALLDAVSHIKLEPGLLIAPGYTSQRPGDAKNPVGAAMDSVAARIVDCMAILDAPDTSDAEALTHAEDFKASLNVIDCGVAVKVNLGAGTVVAPMSPSMAAAIVRRDKEVGTPFKAAWNRQLKGVLGTSRPIEYRDGDPGCQAAKMVSTTTEPLNRSCDREIDQS